MRTPQRIAADIRGAIDDTEELARELAALPPDRTPTQSPDIDPDDDSPDPDDAPDDNNDSATDQCDCPCESCRDGDCKNCSMDPCDFPGCDHGDRGPDDDDED
jgi:hypothetical protein